MTAWTLDDVRRLGRPFVDASAPIAPKPVLVQKPGREFDSPGQSGPSKATSPTAAALTNPGSKPSKYRNRKTLGPDPAGGERLYDSKREAAAARQFRDEASAGLWRTWLVQPSLVIGTSETGRSIRYRADFLAIDPEGRAHWFDSKGRDTPNSRTKRAVLRDRGIDVQVVR